MGIDLPFRRQKDELDVVMISISCCMHGAASIEDQARKVIEQAILETGVKARFAVMPATKAYFGGAPRAVMAKLMSDANQGQLQIPAILIDGKAVHYGVPSLKDFKSVLLQAAQEKQAKEEHSRA